MPYLKLYKAGVKHESLVTDQPQGYDSMLNLVNTQGKRFGCFTFKILIDD